MSFVPRGSLALPAKGRPAAEERMPTDLTIPPDKAAAPQLGVAQLATAILQHATSTGRFPTKGTERC
jgi:hypothetical protein